MVTQSYDSLRVLYLGDIMKGQHPDEVLMTTLTSKPLSGSMRQISSVTNGKHNMGHNILNILKMSV